MSGSHLEIDPVELRTWFDEQAFRIGHTLSDHPLFGLDRLIELANTLPPIEIEYNAGEVPIDHDPNLTPANGLSANETIRRIRECKSWLVLKRVERDPDYRVLLNACLDEVRPHRLFLVRLLDRALRDGYG